MVSTHQTLSTTLILLGAILGVLCLINAFIINYFSEKSPEELNQIGMFTNLLTRLCRIVMFLCKLIHPLKMLLGIFCLYLVILSISANAVENDKSWDDVIITHSLSESIKIKLIFF